MFGSYVILVQPIKMARAAKPEKRPGEDVGGGKRAHRCRIAGVEVSGFALSHTPQGN